MSFRVGYVSLHNVPRAFLFIILICLEAYLSQNFPSLDSNIHPYIPHLWCLHVAADYMQVSDYQDFSDRCQILTDKLKTQGFEEYKLIKTMAKLYGRHHKIVGD